MQGSTTPWRASGFPMRGWIIGQHLTGYTRRASGQARARGGCIPLRRRPPAARPEPWAAQPRFSPWPSNHWHFNHPPCSEFSRVCTCVHVCCVGENCLSAALNLVDSNPSQGLTPHAACLQDTASRMTSSGTSATPMHHDPNSRACERTTRSHSVRAAAGTHGTPFESWGHSGSIRVRAPPLYIDLAVVGCVAERAR